MALQEKTPFTILQNEFHTPPHPISQCPAGPLVAVLRAQNRALGSLHAMDSPVSAHPPLRFPLMAPYSRTSPCVERRSVFMLLLSWMCTNVYVFASFHLSEQCLSASDTVREGTWLFLCGKGGFTAWYIGVGQSLSCHCFADGFRRVICGRKAVPNPACVLSLLVMMMHLHLGHPPAVAMQQVTKKNPRAL